MFLIIKEEMIEYFPLINSIKTIYSEERLCDISHLKECIEYQKCI